VVDHYTSIYAATDEVHDPQVAAKYGDKIVSRRGIEVGQVFYFGDKYSRPMGAVAAGPDGEPIALEMGSYGIGVSRLVGALIEANHDDAGIIWPESVAPFRVGLINLRAGDMRCRKAAEDLYGKLRGAGVEVLYDDRDESPGAKFAAMDLIGLPEQLVIGPRGLAAGTVETKHRRSGERRELSVDAALARLAPV
jgi:prolyl-tRNA synthetase